ncbi:agmatinase [Alphaproteobacteria bacterium]|jgi:agmatinase|nr:agmatinase [Alphaproteobacteria bacterium]MDA9190005.1 agmatinase [Alphaproteobacteria bacterium]MDA9815731.1 agmatinase [Alphaproteobacteria bacterium]
MKKNEIKQSNPAVLSDALSDQAWRNSKVGRKFFEPTYGGATSLLRRPYSRAFEEADIVVAGIPFDNATTYRPGCRLGPRAIRAASVQLAELPAFPFAFDPFSKLNVIDSGDFLLNPHQPESIITDIYQQAKSIITSGASLLSMGGDHFISYPLLKAHAEIYGPLSLLQFDAHCDTWTSMGEFDHGTMFLRAIEEGLIDVEHSIQIGLRTHNDLDVGIKQITSPQIHEKGISSVLDEILSHLKGRSVYVSFDIDILDPAFAPGTGTPVSGGIASWQALSLIRGLAPLNMIGLDLVEVSPPFDHAEITAIAAATIIHDWICVRASQVI